ncbi:MAG: hypothetical protein JWO30_52 [Fibrobacteres bacterium]|nr:hypothetical protein [Fibrobacterota bacterium]
MAPTSAPTQVQAIAINQPWNPGIAFLLSLIFPGAGQMYKGKVGAGFAWFVGTVVGYCFFVFPGAILHLICVIDAAASAVKTSD